MPDHTRHSVLFPDLFDRPLEVAFSEPSATSDAGAVLLKRVDERLGLTRALVEGLRDRRQGGKVRHELADLVRQRVFGLACGYADANDAARIGDDPLFKLLLDRDPVDGAALASQPTLCRFENAVGWTDLYRMGAGLLETVIAFHRKRLPGRQVRRVTIDLDTTDDPTHGQQQLALFNGHYDCWCYLPLLGFLTFNREPEQYLFAAVLRSGLARAGEGAEGLLRRTIARLREAFPGARLRVRLDGGFAGPALFDFLEQQRVDYLVGMARNSVLARRCRRLLGTVRRRSRQSGQSVALFGETRYAARSWKGQKRRVVYKAEVVRLEGRPPRDNARFVVTNLRHRPEAIYQIYRDRGDSENRIKELHEGLQIDRTSCTRFKANQLRVLLTAAAYVLLQALRSRLGRLGLARKQVGTLRLMLLKIGGRIQRSVRRLSLHLPENHPWRATWIQAAAAWGACRL